MKSQISGYCSSQVLARLFVTRPQAASYTAGFWRYPSKRKREGTFTRRVWRAQRLSRCGHFPRQLNPVTGRIRGPAMFLSRKPGLSLMLQMSKRPRRSSNHEGIECWSKTRKSRGAKRSVASSPRRDCWSALPTLHLCEERKRNSPSPPWLEIA